MARSRSTEPTTTPTVEATPDGYAPRLKTMFDEELRTQLKDELQLDSIMQVPRVEKIPVVSGGQTVLREVDHVACLHSVLRMPTSKASSSSAAARK